MVYKLVGSSTEDFEEGVQKAAQPQDLIQEITNQSESILLLLLIFDVTVCLLMRCYLAFKTQAI